MTKTAYYFSHDSNARNDERILAVRMRHKAEGYAVYFMLLERLLESSNYVSAKDYNVIAFDLRVSAEVVKSVVEDFGLFTITEDGKGFYSESFQKSVPRQVRRAKYRKENNIRVRPSNLNNKKWVNTRKMIFIRDDYTCSYCKIRGGILEVDHIIPFSMGGSENLENLTTACRKCNRQKKNKSVNEFMIWRDQIRKG